MMEFVVEHELGATRAVLLERQGKYGEAVRQYLDEGQESEALDLALQHIGDVTQNGDAFNAIVEKFLWRYLSFGCRGWTECASIPFAKIRALVKGIPVTNLNDRDRLMVRIAISVFEAEQTDLYDAALHFQTRLAGSTVKEYPGDPFQSRPS
jgi:hypothetical protein